MKVMSLTAMWDYEGHLLNLREVATRFLHFLQALKAHNPTFFSAWYRYNYRRQDCFGVSFDGFGGFKPAKEKKSQEILLNYDFIRQSFFKKEFGDDYYCILGFNTGIIWDKKERGVRAHYIDGRLYGKMAEFFDLTFPEKGPALLYYQDRPHEIVTLLRLLETHFQPETLWFTGVEILPPFTDEKFLEAIKTAEREDKERGERAERKKEEARARARARRRKKKLPSES